MTIYDSYFRYMIASIIVYPNYKTLFLDTLIIKQES